MVECEEGHLEKYHPISTHLRKGLQTSNQSKINRVFNLAFPNSQIKKTHEGRIVNGVSLAPNYSQLELPTFTEEDFCGDFTDVDMNDSQIEEDDHSFNNTSLNISGMNFRHFAGVFFLPQIGWIKKFCTN